MDFPDREALERRLRRAIPRLGADPAFAQHLRRALLEASQNPRPRRGRWLPRLQQWLPLAGGALAVGFFAAIGLARGGKEPAPPAAAVVSPAALEQLSQTGRLRFSRQQGNGVRVYRVDLADGQTLELWDAAPYSVPVSR